MRLFKSSSKNGIQDYLDGPGYRPLNIDVKRNWKLVLRDPFTNRRDLWDIEGNCYDNQSFRRALDGVVARRDYKSRGDQFSLQPYYQIRWLIRRDRPEVLEIENENFEFPWTEGDFVDCLRQRNQIGMVSEYEQKINGFMLYQLHKSKINILNFAVADGAKRSLVGTSMIDKLIDKLSQQKRNELIIEVRETNLDAQLFFQMQGFRAVSILRNYYDDTTEDAYVMRFKLREDDGANNSSFVLPYVERMKGFRDAA